MQTWINSRLPRYSRLLLPSLSIRSVTESIQRILPQRLRGMSYPLDWASSLLLYSLLTYSPILVKEIQMLLVRYLRDWFLGRGQADGMSSSTSSVQGVIAEIQSLLDDIAALEADMALVLICPRCKSKELPLEERHFAKGENKMYCPICQQLWKLEALKEKSK